LIKVPKTKFYKNPSSGNRVVPCGRAGTTKLIVALRSFANVPKSGILADIECN